MSMFTNKTKPKRAFLLILRGGDVVGILSRFKIISGEIAELIFAILFGTRFFFISRLQCPFPLRQSRNLLL
jgi:hypothetical protein